MTANHTTSSPLVSVVIASYNCAPFIAQTLASLSAQSYPNWECLVTDDGSTDETREVVTRYARTDERVKYFHQPNRGVSAARNAGLGHSRGDYVQFLDADDLLEAGKLAAHVEYLEQHPETDIVYGGVRYFESERPDELMRSMEPGVKPWGTMSGRGEPLVRALSVANFIPINCALLRRSVVDAVGLFDETLPPLEDWDYWLRCALAGHSFQYLEQAGTLALVRSHPTSASKNRQRMQRANSLFQNKLLAMAAAADGSRVLQGGAAHIEAWFGIGEVADGNRWRGTSRFLRAGWMGGEAKWRAKWLLCACVAPFVPPHFFTKVATTSLTEVLALLRHKPKAL